jgi:hypothetical protein
MRSFQARMGVFGTSINTRLPAFRILAIHFCKAF